MASLQDIKSRIGAARLVLEGQSGKPTFAAVSKVQARALASMVTEAASLTDTDKADVTNLLVEIAWASSDDCNFVLSSLLETSKRPAASLGLPVAKRRRGLQDFTAVHAYLTAEVWDQLQADIPGCNKLHILLQASQRLGLRLPSEHTSKWLCCLWMCCSHSGEALLCMAPDQKGVYLKHVKQSFDVLRRTLVDPATWVDALPSDPVDFAKEHPALFGMVFAGARKPIVAPIDLSSVIAINQSFGCRGGSRLTLLGDTHASATARRPLLQLSPKREAAGSSSASFERMAGMFVAQMQSMASTQNKMLELFLGNSSAAGGRPLRALASVQNIPFLEDRPRHTMPALPSLGPESLVEELPETPPPVLPKSRVLAREPLVLQAPPAAAEPSGEAKRDMLEDMLDALADRSKDRAATAKAKKAVAAAALPPAKVAQAARKTKAEAPKATAARKAKAGPVPLAPPPKAPAATKVKAPAETKAMCALGEPLATIVSASAAVAKAKAMAAISTMCAKSKAAAKAASTKDGLILGCPKCRFSHLGCGQCRAESFAGVRWNPLV